MSNVIIVNGQPVYVGSETRVWTETGMHFRSRPKRSETRAVWVHWTATESSAPTLFRNMQASGLSVNFYVDQLGVIWQFCDAGVATAHAGGENVVLSANPWAIGIEVANRASADPAHKDAAKWPREVVEDTVRGKKLRITDFYEEQTESVAALCSALCGSFGLPLEVPHEDGKVLARTMTLDELRDFRGVGGHYFNHHSKNDPGTRLLLAVHERGKKVA